jgi:hypothetical protein
VQELRAALERLNDRAEARALKARLLTLHVASRGITVAPDVGKIVDDFFTMARALIVKSYGTAAWEEPETIEEATARMGTLPSAPGPGVLDRVNEQPPLTGPELYAIQSAVEFGSPTDEERRLLAEVRRLRSETWVQRAADEIAAMYKKAAKDPRPAIYPVSAHSIASVLRKHRDGTS